MSYVANDDVNIEFSLGVAVASPAGTFTAAYPVGYSQANFVGVHAESGAIMIINYNDRYTEAADQFDIDYGASLVTVTNKTGETLPAGTIIMLQLSRGANDRAFGMFNDGTNAAANTQALAVAVAAGETVVLEEGTYLLNSMTFTSDVSIEGKGHKTIIKWSGNGTSLFRFATNALKASFSNVCFDGSKADYTPSTTYYATLRFEAPASGISGSRIAFNNCDFINGREFDVWVFGDVQAGAYVKAEFIGCRFSDGLESHVINTGCIGCDDDVDLLVQGCTFDGPEATIGRVGIRYQQTVTTAQQQGAVTVNGCTFRNMGYDTVNTLGSIDVYSGAANVTITGNRIINPFCRGITVKTSSSDVSITGNTVSGVRGVNAAAGISCFLSPIASSTGKRMVVSSNDVHTVTGRGIFIDGSVQAGATAVFQDALVANNVVNAATEGISFRYMLGIKVQGNMVRGGTTGIVATQGNAETASIVGNDVRGCSANGIDINGTQSGLDVTISANTVVAAGARGISVGGTNSAQIRGNAVKDCVSGGLYVTVAPAKYSTIEGNAILDCAFPHSLVSSALLIEVNNTFSPAPGFSARQVTIASGAITIISEWHYVETESAASTDDLDTINGGYDGRTVTLRAANSSRDVVLKDGTGNLKLAGDCTLDHTDDTITLKFMGGNWYEVARSTN